MKCPVCHTSNRRGARFCRQCNAGLGVACAACGKIGLTGSRFCDSCGAALRSPGVPRADAVPVRASTPAAAGRSTPEGENKQVTVLFCDIVNSTGLNERLGPEGMHTLLDRFFDLIVPEVNRFGGTVNQFMGDGFMALFGAPTALEDHARCGVLAALAIQRKIVTAIEIDNRKVEVGIRMGLNTGFVVVGPLGENLPVDFTAVGDTTWVAARLQQTAAPGGIQISDITRRAIGNLVELESAGELKLKGKSHLVAAWRVLSLARRSGEAADQRPVGPFVGRDRELAALEDALLDVEEGHGRLIGLVGEPGIGKTRLLHEFTQGPARARAACLDGNCPPYGATVAFALVLDLLRYTCGIDETDSSTEIQTKVDVALADFGLDPGSYRAPLVQLLDPAVAQSDVDPAGAEGFKKRLFDLLVQLVLRASQRRPLILALENLHWVDAASAEFLAVLAERMGGAPVLVLATYRPGYTPPWTSKSYASQIALRPLSAAQSLAVISPILQRLQENLSPALVAKAEGNPFFLEELARNALEHRGDSSAEAVPNSVNGVIAARIDRLSAAAKRVLQAAAVLGREFAQPMLQSIVEPSIPLRDALEELVRAEFLYERLGVEGSDYVFRHALTQDVAYGTLLRGQRARYNAAAGDALLRTNVDRPAAVAERLAYHFGLSDRDDDAVKYGLLAAETAQRRWANEAALGHFKEVARRLEGMADTAGNRLLRIDAVIGQAEVMFALGQQSEHVQTLEAIRPMVEQCGDDKRRATWSYWFGFLHSFTGSRPEISIAYCREAERIASESGLEDLQAYSNCCLAHVSVLAGDLDAAMAAGERALPVFEANGNIHWACRTLWGMSMAANAIGDWSRGLEICNRALDHGKATGDNRLTVVGWMRTGSTLIFQGRPQEGIACCDSALSLSPSPYDARMIRSIRAYGSLRAGDADSAVAALEEATGWFAQSKLQYTWTYFSLWLTEGWLRQGRTTEALDRAEQALKAARAHGYGHLEGLALRLIGESLVPQDPAQARETLEQARAILAEVGARNDLAKALVLLAGLSPQQQGDLLSQALQEFRALGSLDEIPRVEALLSRNG